MTRRLILARIFAAGALALACLAVPAATAPPAVWLDVPFVQQQADGCGAASIAMVIDYWQRHGDSPAANAGYTHIQNALLSRSAHGIFASAMAHYFQQNGFSAIAFAGDPALLEHHLEQGRPLIVALKPDALRRELHYVVVAGIDPQTGVVLLNDPAQRKLLKQDLAQFERQWKATGHWTLLALPTSSAR